MFKSTVERLTINDRKAWTLMALAASGRDEFTPAQFQKMLFILGRHLPSILPESYYIFVPYNYGPFASEIYTDAELLASEDFIKIYYRSSGFRTYCSTITGETEANHLFDELGEHSNTVREHLRNLSRWIRSLSFTELISKIYELYPEYKENSIFNRA